MSSGKLSEFDTLVGKHFIGEVVFNNDPLQLCRVKVMVSELFSGYTVEMLPWMTCMPGLFRGQTGKASNLAQSPRCGPIFVPRVGSRVVCVFDKGDINSGIIDREIIDGEMTNDQELLEDYPDTYGVCDENGTKIVVNTKQKRVRIKHRGALVELDVDGNIKIHTIGQMDMDIEGDLNLHSNSNIKISADEVITLEATKIVTLGGG